MEKTRVKRDQKVLEAACRLFVARGYELVSVDEIGRAAGVSGPAVYRHFGSKSEILWTLCNQVMDRLVEFVGPARTDPVAELDALIAGQAALSAQHPDLIMVYENDERSLPEPWRSQVRRRQRDHVDRWVAALSAVRPNDSQVDLEVAAYGTIGLLLSAARWPCSVRSHPAFSAMLSARAYNAIGDKAAQRARDKVSGG